MFEGETIREAIRRDGKAREDRDTEVDDVLAEKERLGWENELPLLNRDYSEYSSGDELFRPSEGETLEALANHELVRSAEDMADELNCDVETIEDAAELHGVDIPEQDTFDVEVTEVDRLTALLGDVPEEAVDPSNPLVVFALYAECGLSLAETTDVLDEATEGENTVQEEVVRQTAVDAKVIDGMTTVEQEHRRKQSRFEVNRPRHEGSGAVDNIEL